MEWHLISLISQDLFVETNTEPKKSFAAPLFMMMTNGFGAVLGSFTSGWAIDKYFTKSLVGRMIWLVFLKQKQRT
jgi:hypothetical protein